MADDETWEEKLKSAREMYQWYYDRQDWDQASYLKNDLIPRIEKIIAEEQQGNSALYSELKFERASAPPKGGFLSELRIEFELLLSEEQAYIIDRCNLYDEPCPIVPDHIERIWDLFESPGVPKLQKFTVYFEDIKDRTNLTSNINKKVKALRWKLLQYQKQLRELEADKSPAGPKPDLDERMRRILEDDDEY